MKGLRWTASSYWLYIDTVSSTKRLGLHLHLLRITFSGPLIMKWWILRQLTGLLEGEIGLSQGVYLRGKINTNIHTQCRKLLGFIRFVNVVGPKDLFHVILYSFLILVFSPHCFTCEWNPVSLMWKSLLYVL